MSEGQMITIVLCIMYTGVDKGPNKYGLQAGFGPRAAIWEGLHYNIWSEQYLTLKYLSKVNLCQKKFQLSHWIYKTVVLWKNIIFESYIHQALFKSYDQ